MCAPRGAAERNSDSITAFTRQEWIIILVAIVALGGVWFGMRGYDAKDGGDKQGVSVENADVSDIARNDSGTRNV